MMKRRGESAFGVLKGRFVAVPVDSFEQIVLAELDGPRDADLTNGRRPNAQIFGLAVLVSLGARRMKRYSVPRRGRIAMY
jgi:hypothetical protein